MEPRRIKIASDDTEYDELLFEAGEGKDDGSDNRRTRLLSRSLAAAVGAVVLGYTVLAVVLNVLVDSERLRAWLEPRASAALNRPVSTGDVRVALLPRPSIHVSDVRVDNLDGVPGPAIAFMERVRFDVRLLPLALGRVDVHRVHLDGPRLNLMVDETGRSNFGDLLPGTSTDGDMSGAPLRLGIERVVVSEANLAYFNAPSGRSFTISGGHVRATVSPEGAAGWHARIEAESDSLLARVATVTDEIVRVGGPSATLSARSNGSDRWIAIEDGVVELAGETLMLSGRLSGLSSSRPSYDLQLTNDAMDAGVLIVALPADFRSTRVPALDGELGVTLQIIAARSPGEPPIVQGSVRLADVALHMDGRILVDRLNGTIGVSPDTLVMDSLTGLFADGPFELSGTVGRDDRAVAIRTRGRPDLDALDRLGLVPAGLTLSGDAEVDLSVTGRLGALDSAEVAGSIAVEGLQAKHTRIGVPLYVPAGVLTLVGEEVAWNELTVLIGRDEIVSTGYVTGLVAGSREGARPPSLRASIAAPRLDLGAALPRPDGRPEVSYGRVAFAHLGGHTLDGEPVAAVVSRLGLARPARMHWLGEVALDVDTLDFHRYHLSDVSARIEISDSSIAVEAPSFAIWGGVASGTIQVGVGAGPEQPFSLRLSTTEASAEDLLSALTPIGGSVTGTLTLELEVAGSLDSRLLPVGRDIAGHARVDITDGRIHGTGPNLVVADFLGSADWEDVEFETWPTQADLVARRIEVRSSELTGPEGRVAFDGLVHLDGSHDLSLGLSIPPDRLGAVSLRRTGIGQSVLQHLATAGSSLDLGLRMSGVLGAPQLEPDASNAVALAR